MAYFLLRARKHRTAFVFVASGFVLLAVAVLGLDRLRSMTIGLDLRVTEVAFSSSELQPLFVGFRVSHVEVRAPAGVVDLPRPLQSRENSGLSLSAAVLEGDTGIVSVDALLVAPGTRIRLGRLNGRGRYRLTLDKPKAPLTLTVQGPVDVKVADHASTTVFEHWGQVVFFVPDTAELEVEFTLAGSESVSFFPAFYADDLDFTRTVWFQKDSLRLLRQVSGIEGGTYTLESLGGEQRAVRPGQSLGFKTSKGLLRHLRADETGMDLGFYGEVTGMWGGARGVRRRLMPSSLSWFVARQTPMTLIGAALTIIGLLGTLGVLQRARKFWSE